MKTKTFSNDINLKINRFLAKTDFSVLQTESEISSLLGSYLTQSGYDVMQGFDLRRLKSIYEHPFPSVEMIDLMVKSPFENEFFPIEIKYFKGIKETHQRRKDLEKSFEAIQTMLNTYGVMESGRTICITDNPYISGDVRTARRLNIIRKNGTKFLQAPSPKRAPSMPTPKGIDWKEASNESNLKYAAIKSEPIKEPKGDWIDNADEVICSWHEQFKKRPNAEL